MALPGPVQVIWATGERAILSLPRQEQKLSLPSVSLNTRRYRLKLRQALSLTNQIVIASTTGFQRDESLWAYLPASPVQTFAPLPLRKETPSKPPESSEWIVRLYPGNRRAGGFIFVGTETQTILLRRSPKSKRYQPKQWQALSMTNQIVIASTAGFQRDESLWA